MCFRLREKKTDSWKLSQKNFNALFAYVYSVKYPIFMHYVTITSSSMYSVDICAVSQLLMMRQNIKQTVGTIHSPICIQKLITCAECRKQIRSFEFNFDLLFHVYIIIRGICMFVTLSKYNRLVLFLILFYEMEDV
jgi:hypothetical protein